MAKRGRPIQGAQLVPSVPGSQTARQRLVVVLQTLAGALSIEDACSILGIKRSGFHKLRQQFLAQALGLLEPRPRGRRRREPTEAEQQVQRLQQEIVQLKLQLKATQIREEIALVMPHLLNNKRRSAGKKTPRKSTRGGSTRSVR